VTFKVRLTRDAESDLDRLFDFLLERELSRDGGDLSLPTQAIAALQSGIATLKTSPFTCRKAGQSPFLRELVIPFGRSGYLALFEIEDGTSVAVLAVRHQLEDDYH
jgi:plasmid stabilization system protein ParE